MRQIFDAGRGRAEGAHGLDQRATERQAGCRRSKAGANALFAIKCCLENMSWHDFLDWKTCRVAAA